MSDTVQPISVGSIIKEHGRSLEKKRDISKWFLEEKLVVDFGDSVGRPSSLITLQKEYLTRFLENGWTIDAVMNTTEVGQWSSFRRSEEESINSSSVDTVGNNETKSGTTKKDNTVSYVDSQKTSNSSSGTSESSTSNEYYTSETSNDSSSESNSTSKKTENSTSSKTRDYTDTDNYVKNSSVDSTSSSGEKNNSGGSTSNNSSGYSGGGSTSNSSSGKSDAYSGKENTSVSNTTSNETQDRTNVINEVERSSSNSTESSTTHSDSKSKSSSNSNSNSKKNSYSSSSSHSSGAENTSSTNTSNTNGESSTTENGSTSETKQGVGSEKTSSVEMYEGDAYWAAVQRVRLKRRRMQPELVLQDMIDSYVVQYNEGIYNEDRRFYELVSLYGVMLNRNETEGNAIVNQALDVTGLFDKLNRSIELTMSQAESSAMEFWKSGVEGSVVEIRIKYEALISSTRAKMVGQGTYNGTVWPTVESGITRQMEAAIAEARSNGMKNASGAINDVLKAKGDVMAQLVSAKNNIASAIDQRKMTVIELRNNVLNGMINFIGSRSDAFPQIQEISQLASQIGFTVGAAGNVI